MFDWTEERVEELKGHWATGQSARWIASEMGCTSRSAVLGKAHRLKLTKRPKTGGRHGRQRPKRQYTPKPKFDWSAPATKPQEAMRVTFMELDKHHCRFPLGGENEKATFFCGSDRHPGQPYCHAHCVIAFNKPPVQRTDKTQRYGAWV